jgi:ubiquinone biosynthesis protein
MSPALQDAVRFYRFVWMLARHLAVPLVLRLLGRTDRADLGRRLRAFLESMGLTYLKLGQYLALRIDLLPVEIRRELDRLFEGASPLPYEVVKAQVERELGAALEELFERFEPEPLASASVAQVHRARTWAGDDVAVKVQRPGIVAIFESDVRNLRRLARWSDRLGLAGRLSMAEAVEEFREYTSREMSFVTEGRTADRLRSRALHYEVIPWVDWELTTERILTLEFLEGISLARARALIDSGREEELRERLPNVDLTRVARRLAHSTLRQLFVIGFFHADPHPGNVLLRDDDSIGVVDFGIFGRLNERQRKTLAGYIENVAMGDIEEALRLYSSLITPTVETDLQAYKREARDIFTRWYDASVDPDAPIEQRHVGKYSNEMLALMYRHRMQMSMDLLLFWRTLIALDSSALRMAGGFDLLTELNRFFERSRNDRAVDALAEALEPRRIGAWLERAPETARRASGLLRDLHRRSFVLPVQVQRPAQARRVQDARWRRLSLAVTGVSFAVLAAGAPWEPPVAAAAAWTASALVTLRAVLPVRR